jgi:hypothetical protein
MCFHHYAMIITILLHVATSSTSLTSILTDPDAYASEDMEAKFVQAQQPVQAFVDQLDKQ